jgi:hypothetical protein
MATIYRKTPKGQAEIETRAHHLPPRLRTPLIMVDGKRSVDELRKLITNQPDECLVALLEQGFIEAAEVATAPKPTAPPAPAAPASGTITPGVDALRRQAVRELNELLGPMGEAVAIKLEGAKSLEQLRHSLGIARDILANSRGAGAANAFAARYLEPLGG